MPDVSSAVVAILCSDLHLSQTAPVARTGEPDWFAAMARPLKELSTLAANHNVPILCAGDIFDRWTCTPELLNFALRNLPVMYAIPGQHDMPNHSYRELERSAYGTLVLADRIKNLPANPLGLTVAPSGKHVFVHSFPWGMPLEPLLRGTRKTFPGLHVAVVHHYIWKNGKSHPGALPEDHINRMRERLAGYDTLVFGDNHQGFIATVGDPVVCNCGGFMRRNSDQEHYKPRVGLLREDGSVDAHYLDTTADVHTPVASIEDINNAIDLRHFIQSLRSAELIDDFDFKEFVRQYYTSRKLTPEVVRILMKSVGYGDEKQGAV